MSFNDTRENGALFRIEVEFGDCRWLCVRNCGFCNSWRRAHNAQLNYYQYRVYHMSKVYDYSVQRSVLLIVFLSMNY